MSAYSENIVSEADLWTMILQMSSFSADPVKSICNLWICGHTFQSQVRKCVYSYITTWPCCDLDLRSFDLKSNQFILSPTAQSCKFG